MYGIYSYIYHKNQPNVGKYTIHGCYGSVTRLESTNASTDRDDAKKSEAPMDNRPKSMPFFAGPYTGVEHKRKQTDLSIRVGYPDTET